MHMKNLKICLTLLVILLTSQLYAQEKKTNTAPRAIWSTAQASNWQKKWGWLRGSNFIPSTAINQLEMWQKDTFDPTTIDRELGYAEGIGMNSMRVFLHHAAWMQDKQGFKDRVADYLAIADKHHIATLFVLFDDCWNANYQVGKQPAPKPGIHNSGWLRDPGDIYYAEPKVVDTLQAYVMDILTTFKDDKRIVLWDLYNEPGNSKNGNKSMPLLKKVFEWGRTANPSQPLSAGVWDFQLKELTDYQLKNSDVITYHNYGDVKNHQQAIDTLRSVSKRPLVCTEYMARSKNSLFSTIMPLLKKEHIAAYNWGLVEGKTNTKYTWDVPMPDGGEPALWFHEIFHQDGTAYKQDEVDVIKSLTGAAK